MWNIWKAFRLLFYSVIIYLHLVLLVFSIDLDFEVFWGIRFENVLLLTHVKHSFMIWPIMCYPYLYIPYYICYSTDTHHSTLRKQLVLMSGDWVPGWVWVQQKMPPAAKPLGAHLGYYHWIALGVTLGFTGGATWNHQGNHRERHSQSRNQDSVGKNRSLWAILTIIWSNIETLIKEKQLSQ